MFYKYFIDVFANNTYLCRCKYNIKYTTMQPIISDSQALSAYLSRFPRPEKSSVIDNICQACMVPRHTIFNWSRGLARIPDLHKCKIEEVIGENIFSDIKN